MNAQRRKAACMPRPSAFLPSLPHSPPSFGFLLSERAWAFIRVFASTRSFRKLEPISIITARQREEGRKRERERERESAANRIACFLAEKILPSWPPLPRHVRAGVSDAFFMHGRSVGLAFGCCIYFASPSIFSLSTVFFQYCRNYTA